MSAILTKINFLKAVASVVADSNVSLHLQFFPRLSKSGCLNSKSFTFYGADVEYIMTSAQHLDYVTLIIIHIKAC